MQLNRNYALLPKQITDVPTDSGGIYSFQLRLPGNNDLGLHRNSEKNVCDLAENLAYIVRKCIRVLRDESFFGEVSRDVDGAHLRSAYDVTFRSNLNHFDSLLSTLFENVSVEKLLNIANATRVFLQFSSPFYIGMTHEQSLHTRLNQHLTGQTYLKDRVSAYKLGWQHTAFSWVVISVEESQELRKMEKFMQSIFVPALSKR